MFNTLAGLFLLQPLLQPSLLTGRSYRDVVGGGGRRGGREALLNTAITKCRVQNVQHYSVIKQNNKCTYTHV